jgi:hypothetical protein
MLSFSKTESALKSKIIFHASTLGIAERQQLGVAELSPSGFRLELRATRDASAVAVAVPFSSVQNVRAFQKKTYSSTFYLVHVDFFNDAGKPCMVAFEIRVFLRRGRAVTAARAWKDLFRTLKNAPGCPPAA